MSKIFHLLSRKELVMTIKNLTDERRIPWVLNIPEHITKVVVHNGQFHADDVFCVAILKECYNENITVKRVPRNAVFDKYGYETLVCDVGMEYDGVRKFDHHQIPRHTLRSNELRAAIGLLWDTYGNDIYHRLTSLIRDVDKHDIDCRQFRSQLCVSIGAFNPDWNATDKERDECFDMAVDVARQIIRATIISDTHNMRAIRQISEHHTIEGGVMFLDTNAPYDQLISSYDVKIVARFNKDRYQLKAVNGHSFNPRWSGNPPFENMSMSNWIVETPSKDVVLKLAKII